jgi:hypothetical protein
MDTNAIAPGIHSDHPLDRNTLRTPALGQQPHSAHEIDCSAELSCNSSIDVVRRQNGDTGSKHHDGPTAGMEGGRAGRYRDRTSLDRTTPSSATPAPGNNTAPVPITTRAPIVIGVATVADERSPLTGCIWLSMILAKRPTTVSAPTVTDVNDSIETPDSNLHP